MRIGIDNVDIGRIEASNEFLERFFTAHEVEYLSSFELKGPSAAGMMAVKEAVLKALGTGMRRGLKFKDIEVLHDSLGKPYAKLYDGVKEAFDKLPEKNIEISITHAKNIASAVCLLF